MINARVSVPTPRNEPVWAYAPGSSERLALKDQLRACVSEEIEIPLIIGGREVTTTDLGQCILPHDHHKTLAKYHKGNKVTVNQAIDAAAQARPEWAAMPWEARAAIFLKAADLLAGKYRPILNAATMLNQSKTVMQAEVDAACELIDFWRFNPAYMQQIFEQQPDSPHGMWNYVEYRPLEGFVLAITPFNFTSIAGNLPTSPAMMGNTVVWKPASTAVYAAYWLMQLLKEAGLPDGVINMVPGSGGQIGTPAMTHPDLGGVHFTGSTEVFRGMWRTVGQNIASYKSYPRIVGETGGKDFVFAHASADPEELATNIIRGAFEYQGQKCSATSRAYVPESLWSRCRDQLCDEVEAIPYGDVTDFTNFMGAVIDQTSFDLLTRHIRATRTDADAEIECGGGYDEATGFFVAPTVDPSAHDPHYKDDGDRALRPGARRSLCIRTASTSRPSSSVTRRPPTRLTGAIVASDRKAINLAHEKTAACRRQLLYQ